MRFQCEQNRGITRSSLPKAVRCECLPSFGHDATPATGKLVSQISFAGCSDCSDQTDHADADPVGSFFGVSR